MQEFAFQVLGQVSIFKDREDIHNVNMTCFQLTGVLRHELMDFMFSDPTMLDDLDFLFKSDMARRLMFYYQEEVPIEEAIDISQLTGQARADAICRANLLKMQKRDVQPIGGGCNLERENKFLRYLFRCQKAVSRGRFRYNFEWNMCLYFEKFIKESFRRRNLPEGGHDG